MQIDPLLVDIFWLFRTFLIYQELVIGWYSVRETASVRAIELALSVMQGEVPYWWCAALSCSVKALRWLEPATNLSKEGMVCPWLFLRRKYIMIKVSVGELLKLSVTIIDINGNKKLTEYCFWDLQNYVILLVISCCLEYSRVSSTWPL